jgi:hypothetical protein
MDTFGTTEVLLLTVTAVLVLNGITLGQTITDLINQMIPISKRASTYVRYEIIIWDLSVWMKLIPLAD